MLFRASRRRLLSASRQYGGWRSKYEGRSSISRRLGSCTARWSTGELVGGRVVQNVSGYASPNYGRVHDRKDIADTELTERICL